MVKVTFTVHKQVFSYWPWRFQISIFYFCIYVFAADSWSISQG